MEKHTVTVKGTVIGAGTPKICIPVAGRTEQEILFQAGEAVSAAPDLVEWRVDFWPEILNLKAAAGMLGKLSGILGEIPLLFTFRSRGEGGEREISPEDYEELNLWAAGRPEIDLVDVEVLNPAWKERKIASAVRAAGKPVVGSRHYFDRTPEAAELSEIFAELASSGADILKLAVMPERPEDALRLMECTLREHRRREQPLVTMSMGALGAVSRVSGSLTGSAVTFGTAGHASAPGQLPAAELREMLELLKVF